VEGDPMGWWADDHPDVPGDEYGSHVWVVHDRGKLTTQDLRRTVIASEQSLAWMVADGLASRAACTAERVDPDIVRLRAEIQRPNGDSYQDVWEVHARGI
jgi:phage gp46-like protein